MRDPAHPWRIELGAAVEKLIDDLATEPEMYARGEEFKARSFTIQSCCSRSTSSGPRSRARLDAHSNSYINQISDGLEQALISLGRRMASDEQLHVAINKFMRIAALRLIAPRRAEIGAFITQVVERWDTETLVNRIELQVGRDLQYIRINGTVVGGLVGLIIFTITRWL